MKVIDLYRKNLEQTQMGASAQMTNWEQGRTTTKQHALLSLLGKTLDHKNWSDPRCQMVVSRVLIWCFPFLEKAIGLHAAFIGNIRIKTENDQLRAILERFINDIPILNQANPEWRTHYTGLDTFNKTLLMTALRDGSAFAEEQYTEDGPEMDGLMLLPSAKFEWRKRLDQQILTFVPYNGKIVEVAPSEHFYMFGIAFTPESLWGIQMVDGGQFMGEFLIRIIVSRMRLHARFANPPSLDVFILNEKDALPDTIQAFDSRANKVHADLVSAQQASEEGKSAAVVTKMVGNVEHKSAMYGDGVQGTGNFESEFDIFAKQLALTTDFPIELLGFEVAGGGFGDGKFNILKGILGAKVKDHRKFLKPVDTRICKNYLTSIGAPPSWLEEFEVEFSELDTDDGKLLADLAKTHAETFKVHLENIMTLFGNGLASPDKIEEYIAEHKMNIDVPDMRVPPEPPVPPAPPTPKT